MKLKQFLAIILCCLLCNNIYAAQRKPSPRKHKIINITRTKAPARTQASIIVDGHNGRILHKHNSLVKVYPASLTKMMTLYMTFEALKHGKLHLHQQLKVPLAATAMPSSKLGLKTSDTISVKEAIMALIVKSANDVAVVLAHAIGRDSEAHFAKLMTAKAQKLGMKHTAFRNASGLHHPQQHTTAQDLARLAIALKKRFPQYYSYFAANSFVYKGRVIKGHNYVTANYKGAEGMKTGYTNASGYNLVSVAGRGSKNLIGVVIGESSASVRDTKMMAMLDKHFPSAIMMVASNSIATKSTQQSAKITRPHANAFASLDQQKSAAKLKNKKIRKAS